MTRRTVTRSSSNCLARDGARFYSAWERQPYALHSGAARIGKDDVHDESDPTVPQFWAFNPAYAQVQNEHLWSVGWVDVMNEGMAPEAAAARAFKRIEEMFAKYPIG